MYIYAYTDIYTLNEDRKEMKKLINFDRAKDIQKLANKKYGGNFSLAVNSVMNLAVESDDFCNDVKKLEEPMTGESFSSKEVMEFIEYMKSEHAKLGKLPDRILEAALVGVDASLINERVKMLINSNDYESTEIASNEIYESMPITKNCKYIKTAAELASVWMLSGGRGGKTHKSEANYHNLIVDNFEAYFPNYKLVDSEALTSDGADRMDILAKCKSTGRDVIIELKVGCKSAHKQLRSYAYDFEDPILINISEDLVKNKRGGIEYLTYKDLGINLDDTNKLGDEKL